MNVCFLAIPTSTKALLAPAAPQPHCTFSRHSRSSSAATVVDSPMSPPHPCMLSASPRTLAPSITSVGAAAKPWAVPYSTGAAARRDSVFSHHDISASDDGDDDDEYAAPALALPADGADDEGFFAMDAEVPSLSGHADLASSALSYRQLTRPEPWTVRPPSAYDSLRAQIRVIDDDDNEFVAA
ncbi:hypothetical protein GGI07_004173 [Coemansia sp. Benny D115]|nr:hypothetical protein GGI07_004173 [Coemansia sp. Benny D115]